MEIFLASGNAHKKHEFASIFPQYNIITPDERGIEFNPDETGKDFCENSLIKAKALWDIVKQPVLADDSGICVDILGGRPGIFSARYAGKPVVAGKSTENPLAKKLSQDEKNRALIEETNDAVRAYLAEHPETLGGNLRSCRYVCALTLYLAQNRFYTVQETFEGVLLESLADARGTDGFGYDPIVFIPEKNKTAAELSLEEKNSLSHRGKACKSMLKLMEFTLPA